MYDLKEVSRFVEVTDKGLLFPLKEPRKIRLEVLSEKPVKLYLKDGKDKPRFIGAFEGFDVVQFNVSGPAWVQADGAGCMVWTPEFQDQVIVIPDAVSFTRVMSRKERNPELETLMHKMQVNMERRLAQVERDVTLRIAEERRIANAERERERHAAARATDAEALARTREDAGEDAAASEVDTGDAGGDVSGSGGTVKGSKLAKKPASPG